MGRYNRYRQRSSGMGISIFILVIVLAIATGYTGTKYVVFPFLLDSDSPESSSEVQNVDEATSGDGIDVITSLPSIILDQQDIKDINSTVETGSPAVNSGDLSGKGPFSVQYGSFTSKDAGETLSKELTQKGIYSYVYESGGSYKVLGLPYADKEKAREAATVVSAVVSDVFVVDIATLIK